MEHCCIYTHAGTFYITQRICSSLKRHSQLTCLLDRKTSNRQILQTRVDFILDIVGCFRSGSQCTAVVRSRCPVDSGWFIGDIINVSHWWQHFFVEAFFFSSFEIIFSITNQLPINYWGSQVRGVGKVWAVGTCVLRFIFWSWKVGTCVL